MIARAQGRPKIQCQARRLSLPPTPGKGRSWLAGTAQLETTALQLQAGMYIQAWIQAQPSLPIWKRASVALFYVTGVGKLTSEGMDIDSRPVAARTRALMTAIETTILFRF